MNKYCLFLRALSMCLALLTVPLAYGADDGDLDNDGIPDSQERGAQSSRAPQGNTEAPQKTSWREKKALRLDSEAQDLRTKAEGMEGKKAEKLIKKAEVREKDAAKLRHIDEGKSRGLSKKAAKKDFKEKWKQQKSQNTN